MARIKQLSRHLINQIAAGEVIERPSSVVKELLENAIDAQAKKIEIQIQNECRNIRISDNGSGIHPEDIELAFSKHATSKIKEEKDLFNISTLGFRGEALSSIISIAKMTAMTRTKEFDYGMKISAFNSEITKNKAACAVGTTFEVEDLFFNVPARLKFLKNPKTEFSYIAEMVQAIAISNPQISITLLNNDKVTLKTSGSGDLMSVISEIYSAQMINDLKEVNKSDILSHLEITGFTSIPTFTKSSRKSIYTFINNRVVKCPVMLKAIDLAYKNMLPSGKFPFCVINLKIPFDDIDVNTHPQKKEVRYKSPNQIFNFIYSSINNALSNGADFVSKNDENLNVLSFFSSNNDEKNDEIYVSELKFDKKIEEIDKKIEQQKEFKFENNENKLEEKDFSVREKIIGQLNNTFILVETQEGLEIIDQHIADERYLYEKLKNEKQQASQLLLISDAIRLEPSEIELFENNKQKLEKFGYEICKISENEVIFKKIPQILSHLQPQEIISDLLDNIKGDFDGLEDRILIMNSCKGAIKAGQSLSYWQMEEIINRWRKTPMNYTCPHGRPISKVLSYTDIQKFFLRTSF